MSNHEFRDTDEASDARFSVPYDAAPDRTGDLHEDAVNELADAQARDVTSINRHPVGDYFGIGTPAQTLPSRVPGQSLIPPGFRAPAFGTGLSWQADVQSMVHLDLVNFPWDQGRDRGELTIPNIELRTIYAHLIETATQVRAEMRERGMQVDL